LKSSKVVSITRKAVALRAGASFYSFSKPPAEEGGVMPLAKLDAARAALAEAHFYETQSKRRRRAKRRDPNGSGAPGSRANKEGTQ